MFTGFIGFKGLMGFRMVAAFVSGCMQAQLTVRAAMLLQAMGSQELPGDLPILIE